MNILAYISLSERIASRVPDIKHIDLFNHQYELNQEGNNLSFPKPAVFVEFMPTGWTGTVNSIQQGDGAVRLHVVTERYKNTANMAGASALDRAKALYFATIPTKVHKAIEGFVADGTLSSMVRTATAPDTDHDMYLVEIHEYAYIDSDESADEFAAYVPAEINRIFFPRETRLVKLLTLNILRQAPSNDDLVHQTFTFDGSVDGNALVLFQCFLNGIWQTYNAFIRSALAGNNNIAWHISPKLPTGTYHFRILVQGTGFSNELVVVVA